MKLTQNCEPPAYATQGDVKDEGTLFSLANFNVTCVMLFIPTMKLLKLP